MVQINAGSFFPTYYKNFVRNYHGCDHTVTMAKYFTYIMTNKRRGTLYTGMTNSIGIRTLQHNYKVNPNSFTARYKLNRLVWFESFSTRMEAIRREKQIKGWKRFKKIQLIEQTNPEWENLFGSIYMNNQKRFRKMSDEWNSDKTI